MSANMITILQVRSRDDLFLHKIHLYVCLFICPAFLRRLQRQDLISFFPPDILISEKGRVLLGLAASDVRTAKENESGK